MAIIGVIGVALAVSAILYARSRTANFDRHAGAIAAIGRVRHLDERVAEQVLTARAALVNQYDSITATERALDEATAELRSRVGAAVGLDPALASALSAVELAVARQRVARQRAAIEEFKAENSVLENSLHYLPTAAEEAKRAVRIPEAESDALVSAVQRVLQAALVYGLIGDRSASDAFREALADLESAKSSLPSGARGPVETLLAHARTLHERQVTVDAAVRGLLRGNVAERLSELESTYYRQFGTVVASSNRYRLILYGWSLLLLAAASTAGISLRRVYASLERLVQERTSELKSALDALWGEMRLASKIQEALVPDAPELANCEIAASMRATSSVGGDYYDVFRGPQVDWVLIGDVSGHGVPAGLVMMMCQTAVRTLLNRDPLITPSELLVAVNGVLVENIRQLGESKYMTITALRHERDGTVYFSGAHQDIHILRAATNAVEIIETPGVWLGLKGDIEDKMTTNHFHLAEGDLLLLHTDGITEAARDGRMFDTDGVRTVLGAAQRKTAKEVLEAVFTALDGYRLVDDATVLAIRQLKTEKRSAVSAERLVVAATPSPSLRLRER
jgi:serine phosphatase RsbU (regulator of sigma subunit)